MPLRWTLVQVLSGRIGDELIDTYEAGNKRSYPARYRELSKVSRGAMSTRCSQRAASAEQTARERARARNCPGRVGP